MRIPGMIRKVDDLGRIVIPAQMRRAMDLESDDEVEIFFEDHKLVLKKFEPACIFCGGTEELIFYKEKNICMACIRNLR